MTYFVFFVMWVWLLRLNGFAVIFFNFMRFFMKNSVNTKSVAVNAFGTDRSQSLSSSVDGQPRCILRLPEVIRRTGFKRSYVYQLMREEKFPQALRIGVRSVGWDSYAIEQWIEERLSQRTQD